MGKRDKEPPKQPHLIDDLELEEAPTAPLLDSLDDEPEAPPEPTVDQSVRPPAGDPTRAVPARSDTDIVRSPPPMHALERAATPTSPQHNPPRRYESLAIPEEVRAQKSVERPRDPSARRGLSSNEKLTLPDSALEGVSFAIAASQEPKIEPQPEDDEAPDAALTMPEIRRPEPTQMPGVSDPTGDIDTPLHGWSLAGATAPVPAAATAEQSVEALRQRLNGGAKSIDAQQMLRLLGRSSASLLLDRFDAFEHSAHRRAIAELLAEWGAIHPTVVAGKLVVARGELLGDLLALAGHLRPAECAPVIIAAMQTDSPKARTWAVSNLRRYPKGGADDLLARHLLDPDPDVRQAAVRLAMMRRSAPAVAVFERIFDEDDVADRDPRELKMWMSAYAAIAGPRGAGILSRILNPGLLSRKAPDAQVAAALALGRIGSEEAREALKKGVRAMNRRVRDACQRALLREKDDAQKSESPGTTFEPESERDRVEEEELLTVIGQALEPNAAASIEAVLAPRAEAPGPEDDPFKSIGRVELANALQMPVGLSVPRSVANLPTQLPMNRRQNASPEMIALAQEKTRIQPGAAPPPAAVTEQPLGKGLKVLRPSEAVAPVDVETTIPVDAPMRLPSEFVRPVPAPRGDTDIEAPSRDEE